MPDDTFGQEKLMTEKENGAGMRKPPKTHKLEPLSSKWFYTTFLAER